MSKKSTGFSHKLIETNVGLLIILSILVISFAGLVQIVPLFFQHSTTQPAPGVQPYEPLNLIGRDVYIREGCVGCHSQQIRRSEEHTSELQSLMRISYAVFCLKKKIRIHPNYNNT